MDDASWTAGLTFYRQRRKDGGERTGIMVGQTTVLGRFVAGDAEEDPALIWAVDLRCQGPELPHEPEDARNWLLEREATIRDGFLRYADELGAGADISVYPLSWSGFDHAGETALRMEIVCSALRRVDALHLARVVRETGESLRSLVNSLRPVGSAQRV